MLHALSLLKVCSLKHQEHVVLNSPLVWEKKVGFLGAGAGAGAGAVYKEEEGEGEGDFLKVFFKDT